VAGRDRQVVAIGRAGRPGLFLDSDSGRLEGSKIDRAGDPAQRRASPPASRHRRRGREQVVAVEKPGRSQATAMVGTSGNAFSYSRLVTPSSFTCPCR
jgi:hypothetical protein